MIRRGVVTVQPATPESRSMHGHSAPYGSAIPRPARHCCHVDRDATHDRRQYGPRAAGPFSQRDARRRPSLLQSAWGIAGSQQPAIPHPRSMCIIKETRRGKATVRARKAAALWPCLPRQSPRHQRQGYSNQPLTSPPGGGAGLSAKRPAASGTHQSAGPSGRRRSRRIQTLMARTHVQPDYHCTPGG